VAAIERTAYPRFKQTFTQQELADFYTLTEAESDFIRGKASGQKPQLSLAILLKAFQKLGYLPQINDVPSQVRQHMATQLSLPDVPDEVINLPDSSRKRYRRAIRAYLQVKPYGQKGQQIVIQVVRQSAETMSDPADLINVAIEQLVRHQFELPAFSTLDKLVNHLREQVHLQLYAQVTAALTAEQKAILDGLSGREKGQTRQAFTRLKALPAKASLKWVGKWEKHLEWLESLMDPQPFLTGLTSTKIEQFASQAYQMEISDIKGVTTADKRYTLLLCLLHQMQVRTRDQLVTMYLKRMGLLHHQAKQRLHDLQDQYRDMSETMVDAFADVVQQTAETDKLWDKFVIHRKNNHLG